MERMRKKLAATNWFPVQIVVTNELDWDIHSWLKAFSPNLKKDDFRKLLDKRNHTTDKAYRNLIDFVLEVSFDANKKM